jgi:hypothetical protein
MKRKLLAFALILAASTGTGFAYSGIYGFGVELDGTGAQAANSGTLTLYGLWYNTDLTPPSSSATLSSAWGTSSGTGVPTYNLGTFVYGQNTLTLTGFSMDTYKGSGSDVTGASLYYSLTGNSGPYIPVGWNSESDLSDGGSSQNQVWSNQSLSTNLLTGLNPGTYTIDIYGEAFTSDGNSYANNGNPNYVATFTVVPEPSTWAMMFGGLVALVGFQRLRRKSAV